MVKPNKHDDKADHNISAELVVAVMNLLENKDITEYERLIVARVALHGTNYVVTRGNIW